MKRKIFLLVALMLAVVCGLSGCLPASAEPVDEESITFVQLEELEEGREVAVVTTSIGTIKFVLFAQEAPKTVAHFKKLVNSGFYTNLPVFMQADYQTMITGASDEYGMEGKLLTSDGEKIAAETTHNLWHFSGAVSAWGIANSAFESTIYSDSRFFIVGDVPATRDMVSELEKASYPLKVIDKYKELGGYPQFTGTYTVFGQVFEGMDVVNAINELAYDETNFQRKDVVIEKIEFEKYTKPDAEESENK